MSSARPLAALVLALAASGCGEPREPSTAPSAAVAAQRLERDAGPLFPPLGGPLLESVGALSPEHADCARCHRTFAAELAASWHARAWDDPLFQREWSGSGAAWCVGCHAPLAASPSDPAAHQGVGCAACHVRGGVVIATEVSGRAPHPSTLEPRLAAADACAACHQFDFPRRPGLAMQGTHDEHARSGRRERCQDCHMARDARGAPSHAFAGAHDEGAWRRALSVEVTAERARGREVSVRAVLRAADVGHAVPTGDLYRRLVMRVEGGGVAREAELSRVLERDEIGRTIEVADQRVPPGGERVLAWSLPASARSVRWTLTWHALPEGAAAPEGTPEAWVRRVVAEGAAPITRR